MNLNEATQQGASRKDRKRVGRGIGSGNGKTCGRGHKGAKSRSGWSYRYGYEGGQMSMTRRLPKRGFNNKRFAIRYDIVNLAQLEEAFSDGDAVNLETAKEKLNLKSRHGYLKILGGGEISKKLDLTVHGISGAARQKIEAAGGSVNLLPVGPKKTERKKPVGT